MSEPVVTTTTHEYAVVISHPSGIDACSVDATFADLESAEEWADICRRHRDAKVARILGGEFGYVVVKLAEPITVSVAWERYG